MGTTTFDLGSILAAQLRAVLEAEAENAETISDFILSAGFERPEDGGEGLGEMRVIEFRMYRRNDEGGFRKHTIRIPVLSILPIPMLSIDRADFEFDLKVSDVTQREEEQEGTVGIRRFPRKSLYASFARRKANRYTVDSSESRSETADANMSVKVSMVQTDFPLGVEKILNLSEIGIQDVESDDTDDRGNS